MTKTVMLVFLRHGVYCVSKNAPTLKRYSSTSYGSILMTFGRYIQKTHFF